MKNWGKIKYDSKKHKNDAVRLRYYFYTLCSHSIFPSHAHLVSLWLVSPPANSAERPHLFFGNSRVRHNLIIDSEWKAFLLFVCSEVKPGTALSTSRMQRHGD
jgi:hypothetical protein